MALVRSVFRSRVAKSPRALRLRPAFAREKDAKSRNNNFRFMTSGLFQASNCSAGGRIVNQIEDAEFVS